MGGSKFIPIVIAGIVGLLIGWVVSPDVDDVSEQVGGQVDSLKGPIDQIQAQLKSLSDQVAKPAAPAEAAQSDQPGQTDTAIAALGTKLDRMTSDLQGRFDAVNKAITESPAQQQAAASDGGQSGDGQSGGEQSDQSAGGQSDSNQGGDPAKLASRVGKTGAILLPGQAAIFGGQRVSLANLSAESGGASIAVGDGEAKDVESGSAVDVADNCKVTLAGVAAGAAYFSASDCQGTDASGDRQQAAAGAGAGAAAAQSASGGSEAKTSSGDGEKPAAKPEQQAAAGGQGEQKPPAKQGGAAAASTSGGSAADKQTATSSDGEKQAAETGNATEATVPVGGAAALGDKRIFVSSIGDDNASLFVAGDFSSGNQTRQTVDVGKTMDAGDGCKVTLAGIENGQAKLTSDGCAGDGAATRPADASGSPDKSASDKDASDKDASDEDASSQKAESARSGDGQKTAEPASNDAAGSQQAGGEQKAAAEPAASGASTSTGGEQKPAASGNQQASAGGDALAVGQTGTFGDHKVFVSSLGDGVATLYVVGTGRKEVKTGSSVDLGAGCSVTLDKVKNGAAAMSASGC